MSLITKLSGLKKNLYLIGAGAHAKQAMDAFRLNNIKLGGIFDDNRTGHYYDQKILGRIAEIKRRCDPADSALFIAFGNNKLRAEISDSLKEYKYANCIDRRSFLSDDIKIGQGNYIGPGTHIMSNTTIGNFNIFDDGCLLGHDASIGDYNHLAIHSRLCGYTKTNNFNLFGINSVIFPKLVVGSNNTIGALSVVNKNITTSGTYIGAPAKLRPPKLIVSENQDHMI